MKIKHFMKYFKEDRKRGREEWGGERVKLGNSALVIGGYFDAHFYSAMHIVHSAVRMSIMCVLAEKFYCLA